MFRTFFRQPIEKSKKKQGKLSPVFSSANGLKVFLFVLSFVLIPFVR